MGNVIVNVVERILALTGLVFLSPLIGLVSFFIWRVDGLPILFRQIRVGRNGRPFELLKLRSMRKANAGALITAGGDSRVTPVGRVIRKYKLDEIPQLWNVVRGDMSLVGPRPEVERYVDMKDPLWQKVLSVRPGITDLATLLCRDEESLLAAAPDPEAYYRQVLLPRKLSVSAAGIERRSLFTHVQLLVITVLCSFLPSRFDAERLSESVFGIRLAATPVQR
jgi:lipopolysaccharide/colanic/teichoic acid biosynthesis glycosyltransferase